MPAMDTPHTVIELRRYLMQPGRRDDLIELFEREFITGQQAVGIDVLAVFREPEAPDRFTWLRSFADMPARAEALAAFYDGPLWRANRTAANATMVDSDDVLLLRPSPGLPGLAPARRAEVPRPWRAIVLPLAEPADGALRERVVLPWLRSLRDAGAQELAVFETEPAPNNFPRLPVRSDGPVLAVLCAWPADGPVPGLSVLEPWLRGQPLVLHLSPTAGSPRA